MALLICRINGKITGNRLTTGQIALTCRSIPLDFLGVLTTFSAFSKRELPELFEGLTGSITALLVKPYSAAIRDPEPLKPWEPKGADDCMACQSACQPITRNRIRLSEAACV